MTVARFTPDNPCPVLPVNPGNPEKIKYKRSVDDHGNYYLVETGKEDLYEYIQSFSQDTDINYIMRRFAMGDQTVLQQRQGVYMDASNMPRDLAESMALMQRARDVFDGLPKEFRDQIGDLSAFLDGFSSPDKFKDLNSKFVQFAEKQRAAKAPAAPDQASEGGVNCAN